MIKIRKKDFIHNGVKVFRSNHRDIRRLKNSYKPSLHGFRIWPSSWLLMDYFMRSRFIQNSHILDIGCGWGIAGIYCVKNFNSKVTCVDSDPAVFPYVYLHADANNVTVATMEADFADLMVSSMGNVDVIIGADICFWDHMVDTIKELILRSFESGVKNVVIADPGRPTFARLGRYFINEGRGEIISLEITRPYHVRGYILRINDNGC